MWLLPVAAEHTDTDPADGLGHYRHDIWLPRPVEAAPSDQTSANRVDYERKLIRGRGKGINICTICFLEKGLYGIQCLSFKLCGH
jgi:hypothetical protein